MDEEALRSLRPHLILAPGEEQSPATPGTPAGPTAAGARPAFTAALAQKALKRVGALWPESGVTVLFQQCSTLADVVEFMRVVAQAAGADDAGRAALEELQRRLRAVAAAVRTTAAPQRRLGLPRTSSGATGAAQVQQPHGARAPRVLVLSSVTPLQVAGQWVPELLQLASGWGPQPHWVPEPGEPCAQVTWATLRSWAPEVLVLALPHCSAASAALETPQLAGQPGWWGIPAVAAGAVYAVDEALLCRPGPGLVAGAELLAHLLWPQRVPAPAAAAGLVLRLSLHSGQRCRARLVPNYFSPLW
jgi:iron complex transport system substrate-binding protein